MGRAKPYFHFASEKDYRSEFAAATKEVAVVEVSLCEMLVKFWLVFPRKKGRQRP
jgi:hypothetical protein